VDHLFPGWSAAALFVVDVTRSFTKPEPRRASKRGSRATFRHLLGYLGEGRLLITGIPFEWATAITSTP
jgi:hypothetical protein